MASTKKNTMINLEEDLLRRVDAARFFMDRMSRSEFAREAMENYLQYVYITKFGGKEPPDPPTTFE